MVGSNESVSPLDLMVTLEGPLSSEGSRSIKSLTLCPLLAAVMAGLACLSSSSLSDLRLITEGLPRCGKSFPPLLAVLALRSFSISSFDVDLSTDLCGTALDTLLSRLGTPFGRASSLLATSVAGFVAETTVDFDTGGFVIAFETVVTVDSEVAGTEVLNILEVTLLVVVTTVVVGVDAAKEAIEAIPVTRDNVADAEGVIKLVETFVSTLLNPKEDSELGIF